MKDEPKPYVGWPWLETQNQSLLYELLLGAYEAQQKSLSGFAAQPNLSVGSIALPRKGAIA